MPEWIFVLEDLRTVCNQYCLDFWAVIGNWVAGLGTVAAVIVSLYLARQDQRVRLKVSAAIGGVVGGLGVDPDIKLLWIQVKNLGRRTAVLHGVGWRMGVLPRSVPEIGRRHAWQATGGPPLNTPIPARLEDGGTASFGIPLDDWLAEEVPQMVPQPYWLTKHFIFIEAYLSTGQTFRARAAWLLRERICDAARAATGKQQ